MESFSPVTKNKRGQVVDSQKKLCVVNLYTSLVSKKQDLPIDSVAQMVSEMVGVGKSTVYRIISAYKKDNLSGLKSAENKKKRATSFEKLEEFTKCAIRRKVCEYVSNNEQPTVDKVLRAVNEDSGLPTFKRTTFFKIVRELGFTFKTMGKKRVSVCQHA
ncbi:uncharacterized protein LOC124363275 [Homalodisca vitripennis]|uniref:uncharacterized protein LOC124363275 n=1 Tax=Homalodisca vitripennis TaxID=197043 RepID=UPI001EEC11EA|nr:uncharacterized protein LOC124363275 [Homalodisca vitripennis]